MGRVDDGGCQDRGDREPAREPELGEQERSALLTDIGKLAGSRIEATFKLDASILGGTVVRIGSTVYDGSVRGRLARLKEALVSGQ